MRKRSGRKALGASDPDSPSQVLSWVGRSEGWAHSTHPVSLCSHSCHWAREMGALLGAPSLGRGQGRCCCTKVSRMALVSPCATSSCTHPSLPFTAA